MRSRTAAACLATATMMAALTGCGGDDAPGNGSQGIDMTSSEPTSEPTSGAPEDKDSPPTSPSGEAKTQTATITIKDFEYSDPGPVAPGTEITVENSDSSSHTVTADGEFDVTAAPGETATFTAPSEPGEYSYVCTFHPSMTGTIVVEG